MALHRADCEGCSWSFEDEDLLEVSDEAEDHQRKEMHDVDLQKAVVTDGGGDLVQACPECDASSIIKQGARSTRHEYSGEDWRCQSCGATFDEPADRPRRKAGDSRHGVAKVLAERDPDEPLVTDGGHVPGAATASPADPRDDQAFAGDDGPHKCDPCGQVFDKLEDLRDHDCRPPGELLVDDGGGRDA